MVDTIQALLMRQLSYRKASWELSDYPVRVRRMDSPAGASDGTASADWSAQIVNWYQMIGVGDTKSAALQDLAEGVEKYRAAHQRMPRPGTKVSLTYAPASLVEQHEQLARELLANLDSPRRSPIRS